jgi:hypothetical protein
MDKGIVPMDKGIVAMDKGIVPMDRGIVPVDKGIAPMDKGIVAMDKGIVTKNWSSAPKSQAAPEPPRRGKGTQPRVQPVSTLGGEATMRPRPLRAPPRRDGGAGGDPWV